MCIRDRLSALEVINEDGELERKADMFFKRTITPHTPVTEVDTCLLYTSVIGDLGRWHGRVSGYKMIDSGNIKDCLYSDTDYTEWYVDKYGDVYKRQPLCCACKSDRTD